ncbi:uncharacterized protein DUF4132 [Stackebrandtia albiflava]|uniref:Uncharacterized protein DUF4132 n=1 Tax=Stackebrandtia albiflava TaxID=406432 RepID=A0A562V9T8_9ACTN|nr:DUF4132 domain-containing protein [Stackebrandtia albiflava]TWJ14649.1 uncharacterized protein DUF4132 [Stackebrandtia albiflava]
MSKTVTPERITALVEARDVEGLYEAFAQLAAHRSLFWLTGEAPHVAALDALPADERKALGDRLHGSTRYGRSRPWLVKARLRNLCELLRLRHRDQGVTDRHRKLMTEAAGMWACWPAIRLQDALERYRAAGEPVDPRVVATARRTASSGDESDQFRLFMATWREPVLNPGEVWSDEVIADLKSLPPAWTDLVFHAATVSGSKPTRKWLTEAERLVAAVGPGEETVERIGRWLALVGAGRSEATTIDAQYYVDHIDSYNSEVARGLAWTLGLLPGTAESARVLGATVEAMLRKVPGVGPYSPKIANAAVYALAAADGEHALAQLARLASTVKFKGTLKVIGNQLDAKAEALGITRDEIEEMSVPGYGMTEVGRLDRELGDCRAILTVTDAPRLTWVNAAGKTVKTAPAAVRRDHAESVKELKGLVKDVSKMLTAQSERLDRQFLACRTWRGETWRRRYAEHPLLGVLARRLIWRAGDVAFGFAEDAWRDVDGEPVEVADTDEVTLWHPIGREIDEIIAWRDFLERYRVVQPFKQAYREVYLLTAAEENTRVYSNRFAAHIIRQHQFHALTAARGWRNKLRLMVDDEYPPAHKELPQWGLRAEFWVEGVGDQYGVDSTETGSYLRLATDQIRFYRIDAPENLAHAGGGGYEQWVSQDQRPAEPLPLAEVPPLVLSEILRDVDLFVGVASVGNDPTWSDGGPDGRFREYWQSYSFGELTATAETRRTLLERLVPRLAIRDRAHVEGRFLVVRGDIRTYKIHLGSGNILMTPNDQYLCIVPGQFVAGSGAPDFLPFEGDRLLSVILSKALLLAKDTAITDPTITSQIGAAPVAV